MGGAGTMRSAMSGNTLSLNDRMTENMHRVSSRQGNSRGTGNRGVAPVQVDLGNTNNRGGGSDGASLFDVVHGTSHSRAVGNAKSMRFTGINQGRVSAAVNNNMVDSPARLDPNKVMLREKAGAADHGEEVAYRRENYEMLKQNLEEAFTQYDRDMNQGLDRDEFSIS